ncbi:hypothetical protein ACVNPS_03385 [Candidatus Bipolaricaulota sp. J31]
MGTEKAKAVVVLSPWAARRLIAKGVAVHPPVRRALEEGLVVVSLGTTNAYVAEELSGESVEKERYRAGYIDAREGLKALPAAERARPVVLYRGRHVDWGPEEILERLSAGDVFIKGANVIDPQGICGVFASSPTGGTVGRFVAVAIARGAEIVIPISRSKSIHGSVPDLVRKLGIGRLRHASGDPIGIYPLVGTPITEIEAVHLLYGVSAEHLGSCGLRGGEVVLLLEGESGAVERAFSELLELNRWEISPF